MHNPWPTWPPSARCIRTAFLSATRSIARRPELATRSSPLVRYTPQPADLLRRPEVSMQAIMAKPRGFCAGVERAIRVVELALEKFGAPVYVRKEIVHNSHVVA